MRSAPPGGGAQLLPTAGHGTSGGTWRRGRCRFCHFPSEEERAGKRSLGTEEQDGLAGNGKEAENDEALRARMEVDADPRVPNQVLTEHFRYGVRSRLSRYAAPRPIPAAPAGA